MKNILILTIILIFQIFPSLGEWEKVSENLSGDIFYIDYDRMRKIDGYFYYWTLIDYKEKDQFGVSSEKNYRKVDCKNFRIMFLDGIFYSEPMGNGEISRGKLTGNWLYVSPNSVHEITLKLIV